MNDEKKEKECKEKETIGVLASERLMCRPFVWWKLLQFPKIWCSRFHVRKPAIKRLKMIIRRQSTEIKRRNAWENNKEIDRNGMQVNVLKRESGSERIVRTRRLLWVSTAGKSITTGITRLWTRECGERFRSRFHQHRDTQMLSQWSLLRSESSSIPKSLLWLWKSC